METEPLKSPEDKFRDRILADHYNNTRDLNYNALSHKDNSIDDTELQKNKSKTCILGKKAMICILLTIVFVCLLIVIIALISIIVKHKSQKPVNEVCVTQPCIQTSGVMLSKMDTSFSPCENFYEFACHKYITNPEYASTTETKQNDFTVVERELSQILKSILEGTDVDIGGKKSFAIEKTRKFYNSCLNVTYIQQLGSRPVIQLINSFGGWPLLSPTGEIVGWVAKQFNVEKSLVQLHRLLLSPLINLYTHADPIDSTKQTLIVTQGGLTYQDFACYTDQRKAKYKEAYKTFISDVILILGEPNDRSDMIEDMWQLETDISLAFDKPGHETEFENIYNKMNAQKAQQIFGKTLNVSRYMKDLFGENVNDSTEYIFTNVEYFKKMNNILEKADRRAIANILMWSLVRQLVEYLPVPFLLAHQKFTNSIYETSTAKSKYDSCMEITKESFGFALSSLYVKKYFPPEEITKVAEIFETIVDAFRRRLPTKDWMDEPTRGKALQKLNKLKFQIGYPLFITNATALDQYYDFKVTDSIFENVLSMLRHLFASLKESIIMPNDRQKWNLAPISVNAYYSPANHQIYYPAGLLRKPFYDTQDPQSRKFAVIGGFMAHELTHAFDTTGQQMDADGHVVNWWSNHSAAVFHQKSDCFLNQYNQFKIGQYSLNGLLTLGENIADNGAVQIAFEAYRTWLAGHDGRDLILPGLNMTTEQQFFLAYAQSWCTYYNPSNEIQLLTTDVHSNARFRVIGTFQNMEHFSESFQCPLNSYLNPSNKCSLW